MNTLSTFIPQKWIQALGWTLLHSLWQGIIAALVLGLLLLIMHRQSAAIRYFVSVITFFTYLLVSMATFVKEYNLLAGSEKIPATQLKYASGFPMELAAVTGEAQLQPEKLTEFYPAFSAYFNQHLPLIVLVWVLGITFLMLRLLGGLAYSQRLKHYKTIDLPEHWQICVQQLSERAQIKQTVRMVESALVKVPVVIGYFKPVILLPIGTILGLPVEQVEAIIAHELAHVSRKDYLLNIAQCVVEILFFYHPAIWWMSARIREEREHCCDDMALTLCGDTLTFAKALASLEGVQTGSAALALSFAGKGHSLLHRIQRLLSGPRRTPNFMEGFIAACFLMASIMAVSVSAGNALMSKNANLTILADTALLEQVTQLEPADSLKNKDKGTFTYKGSKNGRKYNIKATIEEGEITKLYVDGKKIADSEIGKYQDLVYGLMEDVPAPPNPAAAPSPAVVIAAPTPPTSYIERDDEEPVAPLEPLAPMEPMEPLAPIEPIEIGDLLEDALTNNTSSVTNHKGNFSIVHQGNDKKKYSFIMTDGVLESFEIDGKAVPKEEYNNYSFIAEEIRRNEKNRRAESIARREEQVARQRESRQRREEDRKRINEDRQQMSGKIAREQSHTIKKESRFTVEEQRLHDKAQGEHERAMREHNRQMQRHENMMRDHDKSMEKHELAIALRNQLKKDKLIKNENNYKFKMNNSGLYIDGEKQPEAVFEQYKKFIEEKSGTLHDTFDFDFEYKKDG